jgi:group I intron endonuclease
MREKLAGIYKITCEKNNKVYIGRSCNLYRRHQDHLYELKRGIHPNQHLQRSYNKYGVEHFTHEILFTTKIVESLEILEQVFMNIYTPEFNILPASGSRYNFKASEQTRIKLSESLKGIPCSESKKKAIGKANSKKYKGVSPTGLEIVFENASQFARENSLLRTGITNCSTGRAKTHKGWSFQPYIT